MLGDAEGVPLGSPVGFALFDVEAAGEISGVYGDDLVVCVLGCHVVCPLCPSDISPASVGKPVGCSDGIQKSPSYQRTGLRCLAVPPLLPPRG